MKALAFARKVLLEVFREPKLVGLLLGIPPALVLIYYLAFGQSAESLSSLLRVLVVNQDVPTQEADGEPLDAGALLVDALERVEFEGKPAFTVEVVEGEGTAEVALREHKVSLLLVIPANLSQAIVDARESPRAAAPAELSVIGDPAADFTYAFATSFLLAAVNAFSTEVLARPETLSIDWQSLPGTGTMSDFQIGVPGLLVFGILFSVILAATVVVRERVNGTLQRLQLATLRARDMLLGVTLAEFVLVLVQVPLTFGVAALVGFRSEGSLHVAMTVGVLFSLTAIGLGLIVAAFARNDGEAANLGGGILVPVAFLSGSVFPLPPAPLLEIGGRQLQYYDVLPATHAAEAMRRALLYGGGFSEIAFELVAMVLLSVLVLALGIAVYGRFQMRET